MMHSMQVSFDVQIDPFAAGFDIECLQIEISNEVFDAQ
jgi:hypothetical protein